MNSKTIWLHADAPSKPQLGMPCNGCGVCCAAEPCPLGALISGRRSGQCRMLRFDAQSLRYRCGLLLRGGHARTGFARWVPRWLAARWIAAGRGCDSDADIAQPPPAQPTAELHRH